MTGSSFQAWLGVPRVPRSWGTLGQSCFLIILFFSSISFRLRLINVHFLGKRCNKLPILTDTEEKRSQKVFKKIGPGGYFEVPIILDFKTFHQFFARGHVEMSSNDGDNDKCRDGAIAASGDEGESRHSRDVHPWRESPQDDSIEYMGTIEKEMRRVLPHLPNLTILMWLGKRVQDLILGLAPSSSSSSSDFKFEF